MSEDNNYFEKNLNYIVGPNGSGKSTYIKTRFVNSKKNNIKIAYLDQYQINNIDKILITVDELINTSNFLISMENFNQKKRQLIEFFNISDLVSSITSKLSGGEKQIILIICQLIKDADLYIFDEPFNNLDSDMIAKLNKYITENLKNKKVIIISHHIDDIIGDSNVYIIKNNKLIKEKREKY